MYCILVYSTHIISLLISIITEIYFINNASSSIYHRKKTNRLPRLSFFLSSTFIYEPNLLKKIRIQTNKRFFFHT